MSDMGMSNVKLMNLHKLNDILKPETRKVLSGWLFRVFFWVILPDSYKKVHSAPCVDRQI